jgi:hypothetical protein
MGVTTGSVPAIHGFDASALALDADASEATPLYERLRPGMSF